MTVSIDDAKYSVLKNFAVLANTELTALDGLTVQHGVYGIPDAEGSTIAGIFTGYSANGLPATTAQNQLSTFVADMTEYAGTLTANPTGGVFPANITKRFYGKIVAYYCDGITLGGRVEFDAERDPNSTFIIISSSHITFASTPEMVLMNGASRCNIYFIAATDISFTGTMPPDIFGIYIAGENITCASAATVGGAFYAQSGRIDFIGDSLVNNSCPNTSVAPVCYAKGTLILTKDGFIPIQYIKAGQQIVTKGKIHENNKYVVHEPRKEPVVWASKFKVTQLNAVSRPICIQKDALGENCPFQDLYVSPHHAVLVNNKLVSAKNMVNDKTIFQDMECEGVEYYHVECENHSVILANGVLSESYLESNNRDVFENSIRIHRKIDMKKMRVLM